MNAKHALSASVAVAAITAGWLATYWRQNSAVKSLRSENRKERLALETFENEGGLTLE
ncbi:MAG: hypothetical protein ACO1QB_11505 [Verrucomicrobiales bacterium]